MEIQGFDLIGFDLFGIDLNTIDINADNSVDVKESYIPTIQSPYIKGHITTSDNTFTFKVNNTSTSVSVNANGDFKYKPTATITQLDFVGVPELESLELYKINGVTTFNVDYPTQVTFNKCDNITENSKVDVYHIRGTATDDFQFTLKYIDDNNTVTTVTESAVIDGDGKWDVAYSGKWIKEMANIFNDNLVLLTLDFGSVDNCNKVTNIQGMCYGCTNLVNVNMPTQTFDKVDYAYAIWCFRNCLSLKKVNLHSATFSSVKQTTQMFSSAISLEEIDLQSATFSNLTTSNIMFGGCSKLETLYLNNADFGLITNITNIFYKDSNLKNLYVPNNGSLSISVSFEYSPLTYESMLRVAGWLKDLTGQTTQTVTFRAETYNALTAEQKATLEGIIVTQKHWTLATV